MSPKFYQQWKRRRRDRSAIDSKQFKKEQDGIAKEGTVASAASSTADSQMQLERREDGSRTSITSRNPSKDGGSDTAQSLWDRAYGTLKTENPQLVKKYESLLSRELQKTSMDQL
jgi:hypothetical protein